MRPALTSSRSAALPATVQAGTPVTAATGMVAAAGSASRAAPAPAKAPATIAVITRPAQMARTA